jgi:pimeloyl-ACP methyl ester carboxylesterase
MKTKDIVLIIIGIIVVVSIILILITYNRALSVSSSGIDSIKSSIFKSSEGDIEYILEGSGPVILISHGVTGGIDQGIGLVDMYIGKDYRYLYISRFGYLKSSFPDNPSAKLQARAYKELLDYLGIDSVFMFGNSAGGPSAIHFAIDYPERCKGLILVSSAVPGNTKPLPPEPVMKVVFGCDFIYWSAIKLFGRNMLQMFVPGPVLKKLSKPERKELINDIFLAGFPISYRSKGVMFDTYVSNPSIDEGIAFESITSPSLVIHAVDDPAPPVEGAREISARIPGCELITSGVGGHLILGHEKEIKKSVSLFISRNKNHH